MEILEAPRVAELGPLLKLAGLFPPVAGLSTRAGFSPFHLILASPCTVEWKLESALCLRPRPPFAARPRAAARLLAAGPSADAAWAGEPWLFS